jgi:hypothetical protein
MLANKNTSAVRIDLIPEDLILFGIQNKNRLHLHVTVLTIISTTIFMIFLILSVYMNSFRCSVHDTNDTDITYLLHGHQQAISGF